jgi:hypothetical protein
MRRRIALIVAISAMVVLIVLSSGTALGQGLPIEAHIPPAPTEAHPTICHVLCASTTNTHRRPRRTPTMLKRGGAWK